MGKLKLVLVEDDPDIRSVIEIALGLDNEIELAIFDDAFTALEALGREREVFRHALLDYRLPGMSGIELHDELRRLPGMQDLRSVLITADIEHIGEDHFQCPGLVGAIGKPFDPLTLARDVRRLLRSDIRLDERIVERF